MSKVNRVLMSLILATFFFTISFGLLYAQNPVEVGEIRAYAGSTIPSGWLKADGLCYAGSGYSELYIVISTTYGTDGAGRFCVPNLSAKVIIGTSATYTRSMAGGEISHTLTITEMPPHHHHIDGYGPALAYGSTYYLPYNPGATYVDLYSTNNTGGGQAHNNMMPYLPLFYMIAYRTITSTGGSMYPTNYDILAVISNTNHLTVTTILSGTSYYSNGILYFNPFTAFDPIRTITGLMVLLLIGVGLGKPTSFIIVWIGLALFGFFSYDIPVYWNWIIIMLSSSFIIYLFLHKMKKV
jgi:microcystin-dependent protein